MDSYLKEISKTMTTEADAGAESKFHIVIGNEAADLDSVVCALVLAFLCHKKKDSASVVLPIVNCKREDLPLRTDVVYWLRKHHIDLAWLVHKEDLVSWWTRRGSSIKQEITVALVDHHNPSTELAFLEAHVVEIVDHHAVSGGGPWLKRCQESGRYRVELVGSCTTLVAERLLGKEGIKEEDEKILSVMYGVILLDTFNLSPALGRFLPLDADILARIESRLGLDSAGRTGVYRELEDAKFDIKDLSTMDLLRRDAKFIHLPFVSASVCSLSGIDYETFFATPQVEEDIDKFCSHEKTKVCVMLTLGTDPNNPHSDQIRRGLLLYHQSDAQTVAKELMEFLIKDTNLQLRLILQTDASVHLPRLMLFAQGNPKLTRKYILPQINAMLCRWSDQIAMELLATDEAHGKLVTPLNSPMEVLVGEEAVDRSLPSFNNRAMVELVKEKRQRHQRDEEEGKEGRKATGATSLHADHATLSPTSSPLLSPGCFTPDNSRLVSPDEDPGRLHHLPSLNNKDTVDLVAKKRQAAFLSSVHDDTELTGNVVSIPVPLVGAHKGDGRTTAADEEEEEEDVPVPFTPRNSLVEEGLCLAKSPSHRMDNYVLPAMDNRHTIDMVAEKRRRSLRNKEEGEDEVV